MLHPVRGLKNVAINLINFKRGEYFGDTNAKFGTV